MSTSVAEDLAGSGGLASEPVTGDAFGLVLRRCLDFGAEREVAHEVVERDDGFIIARDAALYFDPPELWGAAERTAVEQAHGKVLDVGCGAGRHALALLKTGHEVVGLDSSQGAVAVARELGVNAVLGDFEQPQFDLGTFDTFLLLGNNISLLGSPAGGAAVLRNLADIANPGAKIYGSGLDVPDTPERRVYQARNLRRGRPERQVSMRIRDRLVTTPWFDFLMLGPDDVAEIVRDSPWQVEETTREGLNFTVRLGLRD